jgi:hypothetical protein
MAEFKVGDRVELVDFSDTQYYGAYRTGDESVLGDVIRVANDTVHVTTENGVRYWRKGDVQYAEKSMDHLVKGDILEREWSSYERVIEATLTIDDEQYVVFKDTDDDEVGIALVSDLEEDEWDVKTEEEPKEMTVGEISKILGYEVKIIKEV